MVTHKPRVHQHITKHTLYINYYLTRYPSENDFYSKKML